MAEHRADEHEPAAALQRNENHDRRVLVGFGVLVLLLLVVMLGLARWQWHRAGQKREVLSAALEQRGLPPLVVAPLPDKLPRYRHVRVTGRWIAGPLYLDNEIMLGRAGYQVIMAFQPVNDSRLLVVKRGWMLKNFAAKPQWASPDAESASLDLEVANWPVSRPMLLQAQTIQSLDPAALARYWNRTLHPLLMQELETGKDGLVREWPAPTEDEINRHLSYAGQWLLFSIMLFGVYVFYVVRYARRQS